MKKNEFRESIKEAFVETLKKMTETGETSLWRCPWFRGETPLNGANNRPYNGINKAYLRYRQYVLESNDPRWFTFNQIADRQEKFHKGEKWTLKKGSKGSKVEYWYPYDKAEHKKIEWDEYDASCADHMLLPYYQVVFNGCQIEGLPEYVPNTQGTEERSDVISILSKEMNVPIFEDQEDRAYYIPDKDEIHLPRKGLFKTKEGFNATALHELSHATGAASRLNRNIKNIFGNENYALEELVAEISSCYASQLVNSEEMPPMDNHTAYVASWISCIEKEPNALFKAIKEAEKAADYLISLVNPSLLADA